MMKLTELFHSIVNPRGRRADWPPHVFVDAWLAFVEEVTSGYSGDLYEYENELSVRDDLEPALADERLSVFEAWSVLASSLRDADDRLASVLAKGPVIRSGAAWWRERLPVRAGEEFAADAARLFSVEVDVE